MLLPHPPNMLHVLHDLKNNIYVTVLFQFTEAKQDYWLTNSIREINGEDENLCIFVYSGLEWVCTEMFCKV